jgi:hypothetical protein
VLVSLALARLHTRVRCDDVLTGPAAPRDVVQGATEVGADGRDVHDAQEPLPGCRVAVRVAAH